MKAILKFVYNPDDLDEARSIKTIQHAHDWKGVLTTVDDEIRKKLKYDDSLTDEVVSTLTDIRSLIYNELSELNLSLND